MNDNEAGPLDPGGPVVLVGAGKMGGAMLAGWLARGLHLKSVHVVDPALHPTAAASLSERGVSIGAEADFGHAAVLVLAVKPQMAEAAFPEIAGFVAPETLVISVLAGTTLATLSRGLPTARAIVRAMPNTPAAIGRGVTGAFAGPGVAPAQRRVADAMLRAVGDVVWVGEEQLIDAVTGVSGSGPAYVFLLVEALAEAGVASGLARDVAETLARRTVEGAGELLRRSPEPPETLRRDVTSPGGTTAAALGVLMAEDGLPALMEKAVAAAIARARELAG